jgi:isopentenyl phosphate kinase
LDRTRGAVVVSTEEIFLLLVKAAAKRKRAIARVVWLGETDGVLDDGGRTIPRLSAAAARRAAGRVRGASGIDVTGGMALRLRTACRLARAGVPSLIVDGRQAGTIASSIAGRATGGTLVALR